MDEATFKTMMNDCKWLDITRNTGATSALSGSLASLMSNGEFLQLDSIWKPECIDLFVATNKSAVDDIYNKLDAPTIAYLFVTDKPNVWAGPFSIFTDVAGKTEANRNGAAILRLKERRPINYFQRPTELGMLGAKVKSSTDIMEKLASPPPVMGASALVVNPEEGYPAHASTYAPCSDPTKIKDHSVEWVGIRYIFLICAPGSQATRIRSGLDSSGWCIIKESRKDEVLVGSAPEFTICNVEDDCKPYAVQVDPKQLASLIWALNVPNDTKIYSTAAATFPWVGQYVKSQCTIISYDESHNIWTYNEVGDDWKDKYLVGTAIVMLGTCQTIDKNMQKQMTKRIGAMRAYEGKPPLDTKYISSFLNNKEYKCGLPQSNMAELIGQIVCLVNPGKVDCNAKETELMGIAAICKHFHLNGYRESLLVQMRMTSQKLHSTSIRFALGAMHEFEDMRVCAPEDMKREADALKGVGEQIIRRPYTGCCHPLPDPFKVAQYPMMCMYGIEVYKKSLDTDQKTAFEDYVMTSILAKISSDRQDYVHMLVNRTPKLSDYSITKILSKMAISDAIEDYENRSEKERATLYAIMEREEHPSALFTFLRDKKLAQAKTQANKALIEYAVGVLEPLAFQTERMLGEPGRKNVSEVSDLSRSIRAAITEYRTSKLKDQTEIDVAMSASQRISQKAYIEQMIKDIQATLKSFADSVEKL